ncbi:MAG: hypothetical protein LBH82_03000 [Bacteroidales bacterium]|jgi:hypothetical protein|nr:hypothetical protein [Bacteroidales bacterium]
MQAITNNPYRILGVLAGATLKEETKQANKLKKYIAADEKLPEDYSFSKLDNLQRSVEMIDDAIERNDTNSEKIENSLFWFWRGNEITDEPAFDAMKEGDIESALNIWNDLIIKTKKDGCRLWREVTKGNASAFHNFFVGSYLTKQNVNVHHAVVSKLYFLESEHCHRFITEVTDITFKISQKELQMQFLNKIADDGIVEIGTLAQIVKDVNFTARADFLKNISKSFTDNIKVAISISENARKANSAKGEEAGKKLYNDTQADLVQLKTIFGEQDFNYSNIADKVANEILQCSIDYFNKMQEQDNNSVDYHTNTTNLVKLAQNIAVGSVVKGRVKDNLQTLNEMKNKEIKVAIETMQMIKQAYEEACVKIDAQVVLQSRSLGWGQSINWDKVAEIKKNAIDWDKINDLLKTVLTDSNIEKIKECDNTNQKQEFVRLAEWIQEKTSNKHFINNVLKKYDGRKISSDNCFIATMAYGSYEHPQVLVLRQFRDEVLQNSMFGRWFIKTYYHYSPKLVEKLKDKQTINTIIRNLLNQIIKIIK